MKQREVDVSVSVRDRVEGTHVQDDAWFVGKGSFLSEFCSVKKGACLMFGSSDDFDWLLPLRMNPFCFFVFPHSTFHGCCPCPPVYGIILLFARVAAIR